MGVHRRRRAAARAAAAPRPRVVRRGSLRAGQRLAPGLLARPSTRRRRSPLLPRCTVLMGVPTHYVRLLATPGFDAAATAGAAAVGVAARRRCGRRPTRRCARPPGRRPRAVRDDRDRRCSRPTRWTASAGRARSARRCPAWRAGGRTTTAGPGRDRRGRGRRGPRAERLRRLLAAARPARDGVHRRRVVPAPATSAALDDDGYLRSSAGRRTSYLRRAATSTPRRSRRVLDACRGRRSRP